MPNSIQSYRANGKLLLTGEYFVLKGAKSIALPVRFGQTMEVCSTHDSGHLSWKAFSQDGIWFSCKLKVPGFEIIETSDSERAKTLSKIFSTILLLNPEIEFREGISFETKMDFDPAWGFGSSSTLIYNLASWASVDPFQLNKHCFQGSGFDIACAFAEGPILYQQNHRIEPIDLDYPFLDPLYFVYSGSKKATLGDVSQFLQENKISESELQQMNELTKQFTSCKTLSDFQLLIREHEELVSLKIGVEPIKNRLFSDFKGELKSLGAWGGDFFLAASNESESSVQQYFEERGYALIFKWNDLVLKRK
ncbi:GYDIA family GHMP kinase [Sunxiuqinia sp. A32]|uniref:GYDIA family GHMP kinase n=1 Tax=Sunxiuqinia sp. A32 TaxID=3461496 RepID=UPI0040461A37